MKVSILLIIIQHFSYHRYTDGDTQNTVIQPAFIRAKAGDSVTINCTLYFPTSSFSVSWTLGCDAGTHLSDHQSYKGRVTFQSLNSIITITNLTELDSGTYCCHAETAERKIAGNGTILEVMKTACDCSTDPLLYTIEILRVTCLTILIALLCIVLWKSC